MRAKVRRREGEGGRNSGFGGEVKSYTLERSSAALEQVYESDVLVGNNLFFKVSVSISFPNLDCSIV